MGKTKADFKTVKVAQQQPVAVGGDSWIPGGFDGLDDYKDEGDGGRGGGAGASFWGCYPILNKTERLLPPFLSNCQ